MSAALRDTPGRPREGDAAGTGTSAGKGTAAPARGVFSRPQVRHGLLAAALVLLAVIRGIDGDGLWAVVFGLAAAVEVVLLAVELRRQRVARPGGTGTQTPAPPAPEAVEVSLRAHRHGERLWWAVLAVTLAGATALVWSAPTLAAVVAVVALVALSRVRRERRTITGLERMVAAGPGHATKGTMTP